MEELSAEVSNKSPKSKASSCICSVLASSHPAQPEQAYREHQPHRNPTVKEKLLHTHFINRFHWGARTTHSEGNFLLTSIFSSPLMTTNIVVPLRTLQHLLSLNDFNLEADMNRQLCFSCPGQSLQGQGMKGSTCHSRCR